MTGSTEPAAVRIVVGVDGTAGSLGAVRWAAREALLRQASVHLVFVSRQYRRASYPGSPEASPPGEDGPDAAALLAAAELEAGRALPPGRLSSELAAGSPAKVLIDRSAGAGLLVLGNAYPPGHSASEVPARDGNDSAGVPGRRGMPCGGCGRMNIAAGPGGLRNRGYGTGHGPKGERAGLRPRHARPAVNLLYRFATRPCRRSWDTDAMTRRPVPAPQEQAQDQVKNASVRSGARARRVVPIYGLEAGAVTPDDRDAVRQAGAGDARRPRADAGLPEHIEDPAAVALLAGLLREPGPAGVVRSGRCPACGYLYGSGGHQVSCELPASRTGKRAYHATDSTMSIGIRGPDAADRINQLRHALAKLIAKHGWTIRDQPR